MRLIAAAALGLAVLAGSSAPAAAPPPTEPPTGGPSPTSHGPEPKGDVLGDVVVEAAEPDRGGPRLMRIVAPPVDGTGPAATLVDDVLHRDLSLSGQFRLLDPDADPAISRPEAFVEVAVTRADGGRVSLRAAVSFEPDAEAPAFEVTRVAALPGVRASTHRLVDDVMAALTGYRGPFDSRIAFVATRRGTRVAYVLDADGHGLRPVSGDHELASAAALGPDDVLYVAKSVDHRRYRLYREGQPDPLALDPPGSIYGIAFSPDRTRAALTIAVAADVRLYAGDADLSDLRPLDAPSLSLSPTVAGSGAVAVSATDQYRPRIWVDGKAASPKGAVASSPDFCAHPDGTKLVYSLGGRRSADIVVADARGRGGRRVTRGRARDSHPACSPDGRLVVFFSDRTWGEGPGMYLMRIDGYRAQKIAGVRGSAMSWGRLTDPAGAAARPPAHAAPAPAGP